MVDLKNEVGEIVDVPEDRVAILKKRGWVEPSEAAVIKEASVKSATKKAKK